LTKNGQQKQPTFWAIGSQNHQGTMLVKVLMIITDEEQILGLLISQKKLCVNFDKKMIWASFGLIFPGKCRYT
jgi:hypothetical protein